MLWSGDDCVTRSWQLRRNGIVEYVKCIINIIIYSTILWSIILCVKAIGFMDEQEPDNPPSFVIAQMFKERYMCK